MQMHDIMWPVCDGYKTTSHFESQTLSFLSTWNFYQAMMTIKGGLLSSTTTDEHNIAKFFQVHLSYILLSR